MTEAILFKIWVIVDLFGIECLKFGNSSFAMLSALCAMLFQSPQLQMPVL